MGKLERKCISEESAEEHIKEYLDYFDISPKFEKNKKSRENLEGAIHHVVIHIQRGRVQIEFDTDDNCIVIQNLERPKGEMTVIKYDLKRLGKSKEQMKIADENDGYGKMHALMGSLSGLGDAAIIALRGADQKAMEALSIIFLG
jgi:hypothetical protein